MLFMHTLDDDMGENNAINSFFHHISLAMILALLQIHHIIHGT